MELEVTSLSSERATCPSGKEKGILSGWEMVAWGKPRNPGCSEEGHRLGSPQSRFQALAWPLCGFMTLGKHKISLNLSCLFSNMGARTPTRPCCKDSMGGLF